MLCLCIPAGIIIVYFFYFRLSFVWIWQVLVPWRAWEYYAFQPIQRKVSRSDQTSPQQPWYHSYALTESDCSYVIRSRHLVLLFKKNPHTYFMYVLFCHLSFCGLLKLMDNQLYHRFVQREKNLYYSHQFIHNIVVLQILHSSLTSSTLHP